MKTLRELEPELSIMTDDYKRELVAILEEERDRLFSFALDEENKENGSEQLATQLQTKAEAISEITNQLMGLWDNLFDLEEDND